MGSHLLFEASLSGPTTDLQPTTGALGPRRFLSVPTPLNGIWISSELDPSSLPSHSALPFLNLTHNPDPTQTSYMFLLKLPSQVSEAVAPGSYGYIVILKEF